MRISRKEKSKATESLDFGGWFFFLTIIGTGALAYFSVDFGERWEKVVEIVGAPVSLGLAIFVFQRGAEALDKYNERRNKEEDTEE